MGDHDLTPGRTCLAAEIRGSSEFLSRVKDMACISRDMWKISHGSPESGQTLTLTNGLPEEQWDRIIEAFSSEFERLCSCSRDCRHPEGKSSGAQGEPELRFRTTGNPEADTEGSTPYIKLTDRVHVVRPTGPIATSIPNGKSVKPCMDHAEIVISIEAGWAFGTGSHPSTVCSIMAMEHIWQHGRLNSETSVLDMGTGTGILAIIAAFMGATEVTAVDIDEEALRYARHNVDQNDVKQQVRIISAQEWEKQASNTRYDICLANLTLSVASRLMPSLTSALKKKGLLMLSGFKSGALPTVTHLLHRHGMSEEARFSHQGWCAVTASRPQA